MTEQATPTLAACYAKNRRAGRAAIHLTLPGGDRALCGVLRGEAADAGAVSCWQCQETARAARQPEAVSDDDAVIAAAEAAITGPPLAHLQVGDRQCAVYLSWNPLLLTVIKQIPGARWHREERCWTIPAALGDELARRLTAAGAQVTVEVL